MERFDLSYRIVDADNGEKGETDATSLIGQLVPDLRPDPIPHWPSDPAAGDAQQIQICRIMDAAKHDRPPPMDSFTN